MMDRTLARPPLDARVILASITQEGEVAWFPDRRKAEPDSHGAPMASRNLLPGENCCLQRLANVTTSKVYGVRRGLEFVAKSSDPNEPVRLAPFESTGAEMIIAPSP